MTDQELRKLNRRELIEILIDLTDENETLKAECEQLRQQLSERAVKIGAVGSIAEACLQINGVFESAQRAAEQYLETIRLLSVDSAQRAVEQYLEDIRTVQPGQIAKAE